MAMAYFKVLLLYLPGDAEENHRKHQSAQCLWDDIQTSDPSNAKQEHKKFSCDVCINERSEYLTDK
jgi:hypothetical protein